MELEKSSKYKSPYLIVSLFSVPHLIMQIQAQVYISNEVF